MTQTTEKKTDEQNIGKQAKNKITIVPKYMKYENNKYHRF